MPAVRALLVGLALASPLFAAAPDDRYAPVDTGRILEAMRGIKGYDPRATTNAGRFQAEVVLRLSDAAEAAGVARPLFIGHEEWFQAFLRLLDVGPDKAPLYARLAHDHRQDMAVEFRTDRVVEGRPAALRRALYTSIAWADAPGAARQYSFEDLLARPTLQVTNHQHIRYRVLAFADRVVLDQIEGVSGRPNSGALGLLFKLIGEGRVLEYRMAAAPDGVLVSCGRAQKALFKVSSTLVVYPDGRAEKDVPPDRPDLRAIEQRLQAPLDVRYRALDLALYRAAR
jgi:hypothetical protein